MSTTTLPPLQFKTDALAPYLNEQTLNFHHKKHHQTYVDNLNKLAVGTPFEGAKLEEIIKKSDGAIYNNAAQVWNHTFYFNQFAAKATPTTGILADAIAKKWGSFSAFKNEFNAAGATLFGSGWVFLVCKDNSDLQIVKEPNAGNPLTKNLLPLLTFDVWEHAYYLDYQNRRGDYLNALWQILDWKVIERRFAECTQHSEIFL
ncbi:MAG TPA: superoxide dismutase [Paludibacteraceae bacterium]|nr:superoxide dismutase [Paludibacteraceae bacterium]